VNGALLEAFRHNAWATKQLLESCRDLSAEQLTAPGIGTYGGILETFNHIVLLDARYPRRLAGSGPPWVDSAGGSDPGDVDPESVDIDQLHSRVEETEKLWEEPPVRTVGCRARDHPRPGGVPGPRRGPGGAGTPPRECPPGADLPHPDRGRPAASGRPGVGIRGRNRARRGTKPDA